jgi:hypothetical protein
MRSKCLLHLLNHCLRVRLLLANCSTFGTHSQATYIAWTNQLMSNITRLRALEAAAANSSSSSSGVPAFWQAPKDLPFSQLFSDWVASNSKTWQPEQVLAANAIMSINVQVGPRPS